MLQIFVSRNFLQAQLFASGPSFAKIAKNVSQKFTFILYVEEEGEQCVYEHSLALLSLDRSCINRQAYV